jgi:hypothetical protein
VNAINEFLNLIAWFALQIYRERLREASRSGKTIGELLAEADAQTQLNDSLITSLKAKLSQAQGD